ncbi:butyrate kinase [Gracilibacillus sp. S3-1-1]|uniref:Butyrate kinase n=1 Tax=Gracilibacillus pellucidus TaxID=3095368 RepID=A0ACC6M504_9BACI|nr:butyrate kinase [Gracilibacillus sp. S3-1-1]MDX8046044.1 butyrate kinase [Gracilibacillus sp. S3-1-1]
MSQTNYRILVINPMVEGTKLSLFENDQCLYEQMLAIDDVHLKKEVMEQRTYRKRAIMDRIQAIGIDVASIDAVCGRGGLLRPIEGGTYLVNQRMVEDLQNNINGIHVSNLGAMLAYDIAKDWNIQAYIVDPVVVDEMMEIAKRTGLPNVKRKSIFHALNQKSVARSLAKQLHANYEDLTLVVAHMGGGLTVGIHQYGKVVDVNNGFDGDGPFSFERAGSLPNEALVQLGYHSGMSMEELQYKLINESGIKAYLGIERNTDLHLLFKSQRERVEEVFEILAYQVAKEIGKISTVAAGKVNAIALTGELAKFDYLTQKIIEQVSWIADTYVYPGENVMLALAQGTLRVLQGIEKVKQYK